MPDGPGYEDDFYAWTRHQAEVLGAMPVSDTRFAREHVAEEIEDLARAGATRCAARSAASSNTSSISPIHLPKRRASIGCTASPMPARRWRMRCRPRCAARSRLRWKDYMPVPAGAPPWRFAPLARKRPLGNSPRIVPIRSIKSASRTGPRILSTHDPSPNGPAGLDLLRRAVRDGVHGFLHLFDPALRPVARHERRRNRHAGRRALAAGGLLVDPCWRADGPLRHAARDLVLRLDGNGLCADLSAGALVLAVAAYSHDFPITCAALRLWQSRRWRRQWPSCFCAHRPMACKVRSMLFI